MKFEKLKLVIESRDSSPALYNNININDNEVLIYSKSIAFKILTIGLRQANILLSDNIYTIM